MLERFGIPFIGKCAGCFREEYGVDGATPSGLGFREGCALLQPSLDGLSMKDEEFSAGVVDEERGDHGGDVGIGCVESKAFDEPGADIGSDKERNQRDGVEEHEFVMSFAFPGFEDKKNVEHIRGKVGEHEADDFIDPVVAQAERFRNRADIKMKSTEQFGKRIAFGQRREHRPGEKKEDGHVHHGSRATTHAVFDKLDEVVVFFRQERLNVFLHRCRVCLQSRPKSNRETSNVWKPTIA